MGVSYPQGARCLLPDAQRVGGSSALTLAVAAHHRAVEAGVRHAAAVRAASVLARELAATRALRRAIEIRLIPRLEEALHGLQAHLDETEREENLRMRWSAGGRKGWP
jgi:V/A-type H+-transporting ATPase subunit D